jgi:hypothetical protein
MAKTLPYLASNKNVGTLFAKIAAAKVPDNFTHAVLTGTIGLKGTNDRALIPLLRTLGFLDQSNRPTASYGLLKNPAKAKKAIAAAVRSAYAPMFESNEKAAGLSGDELKGLIAQVAGTDDAMTSRILQTFVALCKQADFDGALDEAPTQSAESDRDDHVDAEEAPARRRPDVSRGLRPDFHYNIQIHLPVNGTEETYLNIFNALRKCF